MTIELNGKMAVVTGANRGIGLAIAQQLKFAGAQVLITGTSEKTTISDDFQYYSVNFLCEKSTEKFAEILAELEPDILINNAGINIIAPFQNTTLENFNNIQRVNLNAPFILCRSVIPGMRKKAWGRIVNLSSVLGKVSKSWRAPYSASKFALDGMTAALAAEVASYGILANCVAPGFIETDLTKQILGEDKILEIVQQIPIGRLGQPDEIARFVLWLVSEENTYLSGQNIAVDGGFTRV